MSKVLYSASAENDLLEAWLFIAEANVEAADRLIDQIVSLRTMGSPSLASCTTPGMSSRS
ncbi:type II toxin-antitoxin system RelE/ParE family toxin [Thauera sp. 28]|uniref:type II toxin-antitoxin system RelE/ParE family toxin n=1 Tax=Thauera sp. 28 TaxID=303682 RepID=UPI0018DEE806|nr:type II toxin-antitoxin system RelE/ParE family toxin [Thauera sp. 28]